MQVIFTIVIIADKGLRSKMFCLSGFNYISTPTCNQYNSHNRVVSLYSIKSVNVCQSCHVQLHSARSTDSMVLELVQIGQHNYKVPIRYRLNAARLKVNGHLPTPSRIPWIAALRCSILAHSPMWASRKSMGRHLQDGSLV